MNLKNLTLPELAETLKELHEPAFRAKQVYGWLHKGVRSYEEMTNLPKTLREKLAEKGSAPVGALHRRAVNVVCAKAQCVAAEAIAPLLTEEETAIYKRGRNSHSSVPKNADPSEYRSATGLEALFGYLHLCGDKQREAELFEAVWQAIGE